MNTAEEMLRICLTSEGDIEVELWDAYQATSAHASLQQLPHSLDPHGQMSWRPPWSRRKFLCPSRRSLPCRWEESPRTYTASHLIWSNNITPQKAGKQDNCTIHGYSPYIKHALISLINQILVVSLYIVINKSILLYIYLVNAWNLPIDIYKEFTCWL